MEIELYDGSVLEFPDDTAQDLIDRVARNETTRLRVRETMTRPRKPEYSQLDGMGAGERFMAGAGKAFVDIGRGARQIAQDAGNAVGLVDDATLAENQASIDESRRLDAPLMSDAAGMIGNVAGNIAVTTVPLGIAAKAAQAANMGRTAAGLVAMLAPRTYSAAAASGGLLGALQPTATGESRGANIGAGAATGMVANAAANLIGRIAQPVKRALSRPDAVAKMALEAEGVPLSVAQRTGSKAATQVERMLGDNPFTAPMMSKATEQRAKAFTKAALRTIGENADSAGDDVLGRAHTRITQVMDDVAARHGIDLSSGSTLQKLADLTDEAGRILPDGGQRIAVQVDRILENAAKNGGKVPGQSYQKFSSEILKLTKQADVSEFAVELKNILDDALQQATRGTNDFARLQSARRQYKNLLSIGQSVGTDMNGIISAPKLAQTLKAGKYTRNAWRYGKGDKELSRLTKSMVQVMDRFPNSGTPARSAMQFAPGMAVGVGSYLSDRDVDKAAKLAAATYAIPKAAAFALTNPAVSNYLANGLSAGGTRNALISLGNSPWLRRLPIAALPALEAE